MRIVSELGLEDSVDTLGRWMSHRIAELMEQAEGVNTEAEKEGAKRECTDLILRVWERRKYWMRGQPLGDLTAFLKFIAPEPYSYSREENAPTEPSWINVLPRLRTLNDREDQIVFDAAIADLDLEQDRKWLAEHSDELSDEERQTITLLISEQERLQSSSYKLGDQDAPNFAALPREERLRLVSTALGKINSERQNILLEVEKRGYSSPQSKMQTQAKSRSKKESINKKSRRK